MLKLDDIIEALLFVSSGYPYDAKALISRETGEVYFLSEYIDAVELPDDIEDGTTYISVPHKNELDLGRKLVLDFASDFMPDDYDRIYNIFRRKGAYARFKYFLEKRGMLETWYNYEKGRQERALLDWCKENDLDVEM